MISTILWIACYFCIYNLTSDPCFQYVEDEIFTAEEKIENDKSVITDWKEDKPKLWNTKDILLRFDVMLLLCAEAFIAYQFYQMELTINMTADFQFGWSLKTIGIVTSIVVILGSIFLYIVQQKLLENARNIFYMYVYGFALTALVLSILHLIIVVEPKNLTTQIVLLSLALLCNTIQGYGSTVYCRCLIFAISPSHSASIVESHRYLMAKSFGFLAFLISGLVYPWLWIVLLFYTAVCYFFIFMLLKNMNLYF